MFRSSRKQYLVQEIHEAPRASHRSFLFPRRIYTLLRQEDGKSLQLLLPTSLGWLIGQIVELSDATVETARNF